jgi:heptosyltransferase-1
VDTGIAHLAAALNVPVVAIFCASDPALTGVYTSGPAVNLGNRNAPPSSAEVIAAVERLLAA